MPNKVAVALECWQPACGYRFGPSPTLPTSGEGARRSSAASGQGQPAAELRRDRIETIGEHAVLGLSEVAAEHTHAAHQHGHLRRGQQLRLVHQQFLGRDRVPGLPVIAEAIGDRLHHLEGLDIGLLLRGVAAPRCERHRDLDAGIPGRLLHAGATGQREQVGLDRFQVEALELFGIVEVLTHRVGLGRVSAQDLQVQLVGPPVAVRGATTGGVMKGASVFLSSLALQFLLGVRRHSRRPATCLIVCKKQVVSFGRSLEIGRIRSLFA